MNWKKNSFHKFESLNTSIRTRLQLTRGSSWIPIRRTLLYIQSQSTYLRWNGWIIAPVCAVSTLWGQIIISNWVVRLALVAFSIFMNHRENSQTTDSILACWRDQLLQAELFDFPLLITVLSEMLESKLTPLRNSQNWAGGALFNSNYGNPYLQRFVLLNFLICILI